MGNLRNRTLVFDAQSMRFEDWNGHLRVKNTNLTKANVCEYYGFEIKNHEKYGLDPERKYRFLRSSEALEKAVDSFKERPILYVHKAADADQLDNSKVIGTTGSDPSFSYPYIQSSITIWDGDYIQAIKDNSQAELSASYAFTPVMKAGKFKDEPYDGMMTDIFVDHVALVQEGRAGHDVRVADERLKKQMPKLNKLGQELVAALTDLFDQNQQNKINNTQIADAVASVSGARRKHIGKLLKAVLSDCSGTSDCPMAKDCPEQFGDQIADILHQLLQKNDQALPVNDEEPLDTLSASDDDMDASGDSDVYDGKTVKAGQRVKAFDAASLERSIERRIMAKAKQSQEARILVKPLVGEWASTEDSGEEILRTVLEEMTGKRPPLSMNYDQLKYAVDLTLAQKQLSRVSDTGRVRSNDLHRFGATRLRSI